MSANFEAKKVVVEEIAEKLKNAKAVVFVDYNKLTVLEVSELRSKCKKANCEYKVYKNTLVRKALNAMGVTEFDADLNGPTAVTFGNDEISAAKLMAQAAKDYENKIVIKSAFVDSKYVDKAGVKVLASMPSKEELLGRLVGSLASPISKLARALDAIAQSKN